MSLKPYFSIILVFGACLATGLSTRAADAPSREAAPSQPALNGVWRGVSVEKNGEKLSRARARNLTMVVTGGTIGMRVADDDLLDAEYTLKPADAPSAIDLKFEQHVTPGIFGFEKGQLQLCLGDVGGVRPKDLKAGPGTTFMVLKRMTCRGRPLFTIGANGKNLRQLPQDPVYTSMGVPEFSRDGKWIAAAGWRSVLGEEEGKSRILVMRTDGSEFRYLGPGVMPSWSPDGKRLVFSNYGDEENEQRGIYVMNVDGSDRVCQDAAGWGAKWSPVKNEISYGRTFGSSAYLYTCDLETRSRRTCMRGQYQAIRSGLAWSPDGNSVALVGTATGRGTEIAVARVRGTSTEVKVVADAKTIEGIATLRSGLSWSPDGKRLLLAMKRKNDRHSLLYLLDATGKQPPTAMAGLDPQRDYYDPAWSPDGKQIVFSSEALPASEAK